MRELGFVEILNLEALKMEKQIPHPAKTAGIRDDSSREARLSRQDVNRAR